MAARPARDLFLVPLCTCSSSNFGAGNGTEARVGSSQVTPQSTPLRRQLRQLPCLSQCRQFLRLWKYRRTPNHVSVPITVGVMGAVVAGPPLANTTTGCSPMTDIPNPNALGGATEWIYAGVQTTSREQLRLRGAF
jgi:hypothetical protein